MTKTATDIVVAWVDGSDPNWQQKRRRYQPEHLDPSLSGSARFRDAGTLKFLLRSIDQNAPWVRKVHLIVDEQRPSWINPDCHKLQIVEHKSIFNRPENLPCFNSAAIQIQLVRIPDLAEQFILMDDDLLFLNPVSLTDFFLNGRPLDFVKLILRTNASAFDQKVNLCNDLSFQRLSSRARWVLALDPRYGAICFFRNLFLLLTSAPTKLNIAYFHCCQPYLKSSFEQAWQVYTDDLERTSSHRFRAPDDINHYLVRYHQLINRISSPCKRRRYLDILLSQDVDKALGNLDALLSSQHSLACINDGHDLTDENFLRIQSKQQELLGQRFPAPSEFELL